MASVFIDIDLIEAKDVPSTDMRGQSDPFCEFAIVDESKTQSKSSPTAKSSVKKRTLAPKWNERIQLKTTEPVANKYLQVRLMDWERLSQNEFIGMANIPLGSAAPEPAWFSLTQKDFKSEAFGKIRLSVKLSRMSLDPAVLDELSSSKKLSSSAKKESEKHLRDLFADYKSLETEAQRLTAANTEMSSEHKALEDSLHSTAAEKERLEKAQAIVADTLREFMEAENIKVEDVSGKLFLELVGARNLPVMDASGSTDPYVKLEVPGVKNSQKKSKTIKKSLSPKWNESFEYDIPSANHVVELTMYDWDRVSKNDVIGTVALSVDDFRRSTNEEQDFTLKLSSEAEANLRGPEKPKVTLKMRFEESEKKEDVDPNKTVLQANVENVTKAHSALKAKHTSLSGRYEEVASDVGQMKSNLKAMEGQNSQLVESSEQLDRVGRSMRKFVVEEKLSEQFVEGAKVHLELIRAENLPAMDRGGSSDPFVKLSLSKSDQAFKSKVQKKTLSPKWNESFSFNLSDAMQDIVLGVYDYDLGNKDDLIGSYSISFGQMRDFGAKPQERWLRLKLDKEAAEKVGDVSQRPLHEQPRILVHIKYEESLAQDRQGDADSSPAAPVKEKPSDGAGAASQVERDVDVVQSEFRQRNKQLEVVKTDLEELTNEHSHLKDSHTALEAAHVDTTGKLKTLQKDCDEVGDMVSEFIQATPALSKDGQGAADRKGTLRVTVMEARGLPALDSSSKSSDPFVQLAVGEQSKKTETKKKTLEPKWNEDFSFNVTSSFQSLRLDVLDWDRVGDNDAIGECVLPVRRFHDLAAPSERWYTLKPAEGVGHEEVGEVRLRVAFEDAEPPAEAKDDSEPVRSPFYRDVGVVVGGYKGLDQDHKILTEDHAELNASHKTLQTEHSDLTTKHTQLTTEHTKLVDDTNATSDLVSEFIQATPALSEQGAGSSSDRKGTLKVKVVEARGLPAMDSSTKSSDPFVQLAVGEQSKKTETKKKTLEPKWNEDFSFQIANSFAKLEVEVFDWDRMSDNDSIGSISLPVRRFHGVAEPSERWYKLKPTKSSEGEDLGEVRLSISFDEEKPAADDDKKDESHGPLYRDTGAVIGAYRGLDQDHKILVEDHTELTKNHTVLQADHTDLTQRHETLTDEHTTLTVNHNKVGDLLSDFVQETTALSEAAATGGDQKGVLKITVAEARGLPIMDAATKSSDPFAKLSLGEQSEKTETQKKTLEPKWNQEFSFKVSSTFEKLRVDVYDWDRMSGDDSIGELLLPLRRFQGLAEPLDRWYKLQPTEDTAEHESVGEVRLIAHFSAEKKDDEAAKDPESPVYRDADVVVTGYKAIDQDFKILTEDHTELTQNHNQLQADHTDLTQRHETLTDEHTTLTVNHNKVGDLLSDFVQETPALSEAAAAGTDQKGVLKITVAEARGLPIMDSATKSSDPFAKLSLGEQSEKTETQKKTLEPKWNQEFSFKVSSTFEQLRVDVYDWDRMSGNDSIGELLLPLRRFQGIAEPLDRWYKLKPTEDTAEHESVGEVRLIAHFTSEKTDDEDAKEATSPVYRDADVVVTGYKAVDQDLKILTEDHAELTTAHDQLTTEHAHLTEQHDRLTEVHTKLSTDYDTVGDMTRDFIVESNISLEKVSGNLKVKLVEARNLPKMDVRGLSDPLAHISVKDQVFKIKHQEKTLNPEWNLDYEFKIDSALDELIVDLFDWDRMSKNDFMGRAVVPFRRLRDSPRDRVIWFPLRDIDNKAKIESGEVALSFAYESLIEGPEWSVGDMIEASHGDQSVKGALVEDCGSRLKLRVQQPSDLHAEPLDVLLYFNKDACKRLANSQLQRDVSAVHTQYRATAKELSDLTTEFTDLSEAHDILTVAHEKLEADHEVLTVKHTDLTTKTNAVGSCVRKFIAQHEIPTSDVKAKLKLKLISASNLAKMDVMGKSDPLVELTLGNQETESPIVKNTLNPVWNFDVAFDVTSRVDPLRLTVYDWDRASGNDFMGQVTIPFHEFREYAVQTKKRKPKKKTPAPSEENEPKAEEAKGVVESDPKADEVEKVGAKAGAKAGDDAGAESDDSFDSPDVVNEESDKTADSNEAPKEVEVEEAKEAAEPQMSFDVSIDSDDENDDDFTPKGPIRLTLSLLDRDGQEETQGELEFEISYFEDTEDDEEGTGSSNELLTEVQFVHKSFVALDTEHRGLKQEHAALEKDHKELMSGFDLMKEKLAEAEDALDDCKQQLVSSQHDLAKEKAQNERKILELNSEHKQELEGLQKKMEKQFEEELRKWMDSLNDVTNDKKVLETTLDGTEKKVKITEEKLKQLEDDLRKKKGCLIM